MKEARRRFSDLVKAAEQGESVVITRRGKPVARLVPPAKGRRRGFPDMGEFRKSMRLTGEPMSRTVAEMRDEERS